MSYVPYQWSHPTVLVLSCKGYPGIFWMSNAAPFAAGAWGTDTRDIVAEQGWIKFALGFWSKGGQVPQGRKEENVEARAKRAQPKRFPFPTETPQGIGDPLGNFRTKT